MNISSLKNLLAEAKLPEVLTLLKQEQAQLSPQQRDQLIVLSSRYNELVLHSLNDTLDRASFRTERNQLTAGLVAFLSDLEAQGMSQLLKSGHVAVANPLLLVGPDTESAGKMEHLFHLLRFTAVEALSLPVKLEAIRAHGSRLIVFNNMDLPACRNLGHLQEMPQADQDLIRNRIQVMEEILSQTQCYLIHYGNFLYWLNHNRNRVHGANSQFALYARVREVLDFIHTVHV